MIKNQKYVLKRCFKQLGSLSTEKPQPLTVENEDDVLSLKIWNNSYILNKSEVYNL